MTFFTQNPDLMLGTFAILVVLLIVQTVRVATEKHRKKTWIDLAMHHGEIIDDRNDEIFDLEVRLADAEKIINSLSGREINTRDHKTGQFVSYKRVVKNILQYENKYFKKDKSACQ